MDNCGRVRGIIDSRSKVEGETVAKWVSQLQVLEEQWDQASLVMS